MNFEENSESKPKKTLSKTGKILITLTGGVAVGLTAICAPFIIPALRKVCLPYVPATSEQIRNVLKALKNRKGAVMDLGSGDGRITLATAQLGLPSHGVELNPWLVLYSRFDAFRKGLGARTAFYRKDLWKFHIGKYENIVVFGVEEMMGLVEAKVNRECRVGTRVVACRFPLPNLKPDEVIGMGIDTVWVYEIGIKSKD